MRLFKAYLDSEGAENNDFFNFTESELDKWLTKFYFNVCKVDGDFYTTGSLNTTHYGLSRALKKIGHSFDVTKRECTSFTKSIQAFEDAYAELKQEGKDHVKSYKEITQKCK